VKTFPKHQQAPAIGQEWERRDGSRFIILKMFTLSTGEYVSYYLATGSRPQMRHIRVDQLLRRYKLVAEAQR